MATVPEAKGLRGMAQSWNHFWFHPADPTVLGFIRLCAGLIVLYVHFVYTFDLQVFFGPKAWIDAETMSVFREESPVIPSPDGWDEFTPLQAQTAEEASYMTRWGANPRQTVAQGHHVWSVWFHVTNPTWMMIVHGAFLVAMFCFAIGLWTRVTSVLTWIGVLSYIHRAPTSLFGMDTMINLLVLYLMIGPSGDAFSVDRLLARYRADRQARREGRSDFVLPLPAPLVSANLAQRLIQLHFCIIYLAAGLSKLQGASWWNGTAVWGTLANYDSCPVNFPGYAAGLHFLANHRWLWEIVTSLGTAYTLAFEISFPFLVWNRRLRGWFIGGAILLHAGIGLCMGLVLFSLIMLVGVSSFLSQATVYRLQHRLVAIGTSLRLPARPVRLAHGAAPVGNV
jgi:hypothetical protein